MKITRVQVKVNEDHIADFIEACRINHEESVQEPGNICIGRFSMVGAGAVVVSDVDDNVMAYGVPAKTIKQLDNPW